MITFEGEFFFSLWESGMQSSLLSKICCRTGWPWARKSCRTGQRVAGQAQNSKDMPIADVIYIFRPTKFQKIHVYKYSYKSTQL